MAFRIAVTVAPDGTVVATTQDISGPACVDEMGLIQALCDPARPVHSHLTADYYATTTEGHNVITSVESNTEGDR